MAVEIFSDFQPKDGNPISYGLEVGIRDNGPLEYRNRVGIDIEVEFSYGAPIIVGTVEIDISSTHVSYIEIGDILKPYIPSSIPEREQLYEGLVFVKQDAAGVTLKPFSRSKPVDGDWGDKVYGSDSRLTAVRGVNLDYFLSNDVTPKLPYLDTFTNCTAIYGFPTYRYLSFVSTVFSYQELTYSFTDYDENDNVVGTPINGYKSSEGNLNRTVHGIFNKKESDGVAYTVVSGVLDTIRRSDSVVTDSRDVEFRVTYQCANVYDYAVSLVYLDVDFLWKSIPFVLKNANNLNRTVQTIEGYDYAKRDYNLKVRRTMELKSDYVTASDLDSYRTLGLASEAGIVYKDSLDFHRVRITDTSLPLYSGWNNGLSKVEVNVELSNLIPTA